ncbi:MAG TPA: hypothetical protein VL899_09285 [Alphaproteobacteria bacterium]|nr:hypothetical protein [Alphaproteobacteria bacterium]
MYYLFNPATIWVWIPVIAILGAFITKWHNTNAKIEMSKSVAADLAKDLRESIDRLEQRVCNLERALMTAEENRKYAL